MDVLQTSPSFSSLSVEGVSGSDEKGMLGRRGTQRGSDVVGVGEWVGRWVACICSRGVLASEAALGKWKRTHLSDNSL